MTRGRGRGLLIVLSGPSGAGKGAVRAGLLARRPDVRYGVSATTRPRRQGEEPGRHYFFLDAEEFRRRVEEQAFVEWAEVYGHFYGTPRQPMEDWLAQGIDVVVEKDIQGALTLKRVYPDAVYVFILPPSFEELRARIALRGTESPEVQAQRLASASGELSYLDRYDYAIVNDDLEGAVACLEAILVAEKCRVARRPDLKEAFVPGFSTGRERECPSNRTSTA